MKDFGLLAVLLISSFLLVGCNNSTDSEVTDDCIIPEECNNQDSVEDSITYYNNGNIEEKGQYINNKISITEDNIISEDKIITGDDLKKACEQELKAIEPDIPAITWNEEKVSGDTYQFKGIPNSGGVHDGSTINCQVNSKGLVLGIGFYQG